MEGSESENPQIILDMKKIDYPLRVVFSYLRDRWGLLAQVCRSWRDEIWSRDLHPTTRRSVAYESPSLLIFLDLSLSHTRIPAQQISFEVELLIHSPFGDQIALLEQAKKLTCFSWPFALPAFHWDSTYQSFWQKNHISDQVIGWLWSQGLVSLDNMYLMFRALQHHSDPLNCLLKIISPLQPAIHSLPWQNIRKLFLCLMALDHHHSLVLLIESLSTWEINCRLLMYEYWSFWWLSIEQKKNRLLWLCGFHPVWLNDLTLVENLMGFVMRHVRDPHEVLDVIAFLETLFSLPPLQLRTSLELLQLSLGHLPFNLPPPLPVDCLFSQLVILRRHHILRSPPVNDSFWQRLQRASGCQKCSLDMYVHLVDMINGPFQPATLPGLNDEQVYDRIMSFGFRKAEEALPWFRVIITQRRPSHDDLDRMLELAIRDFHAPLLRWLLEEENKFQLRVPRVILSTHLNGFLDHHTSCLIFRSFCDFVIVVVEHLISLDPLTPLDLADFSCLCRSFVISASVSRMRWLLSHSKNLLTRQHDLWLIILRGRPALLEFMFFDLPLRCKDDHRVLKIWHWFEQQHQKRKGLGKFCLSRSEQALVIAHVTPRWELVRWCRQHRFYWNARFRHLSLRLGFVDPFPLPPKFPDPRPSDRVLRSRVLLRSKK